MVALWPKDEPSARSAVDPVTERPMSGPGGGVHDVITAPRIITPTVLASGEVVIFELKPSRWYVVLVSLPIGVAGLALLMLSFTPLAQVPEYWRQVGAVIGIWVLGLRILVGLMQWLGRTYVLTDRRVIVQSGVVDVQVQSQNLENIEAAFVAQAWAQKVLGIGTLFFRAAAPQNSTLAWEHIRKPDAVRERVILQIDRWKRAMELSKPK
jgi:hypothetical protein